MPNAQSLRTLLSTACHLLGQIGGVSAEGLRLLNRLLADLECLGDLLARQNGLSVHFALCPVTAPALRELLHCLGRHNRPLARRQVAPLDVQGDDQGQGRGVVALEVLEARLDAGPLAGQEPVAAVEDLALVADNGVPQPVVLDVLGRGGGVIDSRG
jgi:hypothetical protein